MRLGTAHTDRHIVLPADIFATMFEDGLLTSCAPAEIAEMLQAFRLRLI